MTTTTAPDSFVYSCWVVDAGRSTAPSPSLFPSLLRPLGNVAGDEGVSKQRSASVVHGLDILVRIHITLQPRMSGKDPVALEKRIVHGSGPWVENAESFLLVSGCTASDSPSLVVLKWLGEMGTGLARRHFIKASVEWESGKVEVPALGRGMLRYCG